MQLIRDIGQLPELSGSVVTDGMFDGVHLGHQRILQQVMEQAAHMQLPSVLLSYWPHPRQVLGGEDNRVSLLSTLQEKGRIVSSIGIDYMLVLPFSQEFSRMSHVDFVEQILIRSLKTRHLIVGYDHRFGRNREGDIRFLQESGKSAGFSLTEIGRQEVEEMAISSTRIRKALQEGEPEKASALLGRPYSMEGRVVKGYQRGRTLGFPTANLELPEAAKLIPANGVYISRCRVGHHWIPSMTNIGTRPTMGGSSQSIETHLLDFEADLYDTEVEVALLTRLRTEQKFSGPEELKGQLLKDEAASRKYHQLPI